MHNKLRFSNFFTKRMLLIAWVTGILISISMPLTYFVLLLVEKQIMYNNQLYGYVVVTKQIGDILYSSGVLLFVFSLLGSVVGTVLYQFPAGIVKRAEEETVLAFDKLNYLSYHDPLTNLPNRIQFTEHLVQALARARRDSSKLAVMFLDLDRFKLINDTLGHNSGDLLLQAVAKRLTSCVRKGDTVARLGGDEFTVILPGITGGKDAAKVAQKIIDTLAQPFILGCHELFITTSIGISIYPSDGADMETLVKNADTAMYLAKEQGRNKYQFYTQAMNEAALEKLSMEKDLRRALNREELEVHYQPIVDLVTGRINGVEALVRWRHPQLGLIEADKFYPLAEETGLIVPLGEWVLRTACAQNKAWQKAGFPPVYVSVNLSVRQFQQQNLADTVIRVLADTGLDPKYLQLEITEDIAMHHEERVIPKLRNLKNLGVHIAIDDFGTGYSSLSCLKKFPVHKLKIDQTFIHNLTEDACDSAITSSIISMAHSLGLQVVAEGVETEAQLAFLRDGWCNEVQGYLFSSPLPAKAFERFLDQQNAIGTSQMVIESNVAVH